MNDATAWRNGDWVPSQSLSVDIHDHGFIWGTTIAERLRTFAGKLFALDMHLQRLFQSLAIIGIELPYSIDQLAAAAKRLAEQNHRLLEPGDDLGLGIVVTPGSTEHAPSPLIFMHTYPLPFDTWVDHYDRGQILVVSSVRQVPPTCWPSELKCRSRMHYYLADQQARRQVPGSRALLLDHEENVCEASTANIVVVFPQRQFVSPPLERILPGVSLAFLEELASQLGMHWSYRDLTVDKLQQADEVLLCSTSPCVVPVVQIGDRRVGTGTPGPVFTQLIGVWGDRVNVDLRAQARRFSGRK